MFIRVRHLKGRRQRYTYYAIVESRRVNCEPRQVMLYDMKKRTTIAECIRDEQESLDRWLKEDQAALEEYALTVRMRVDNDLVAKERARYQANIDFLNNALDKVTKREKLPGLHEN